MGVGDSSPSSGRDGKIGTLCGILVEIVSLQKSNSKAWDVAKATSTRTRHFNMDSLPYGFWGIVSPFLGDMHGNKDSSKVQSLGCVKSS